ncbi:hypothetical protein VSS74_06000 [Conexibacter stalactiti]|uniref:Uncharacterized protein n=1 Tax=Conexibacter stalactiti TaxID=1940611 RepID=A0ABU4HKS9_9ACTN|nr:hypothetical protein [Conexibacter stalactiti]MDW5593877.1 hypothetical protein [Conexibacter stalactiti]MEC5034519.1 hypothetical protein [Conexibacter stalactiti]
MTVRCPSACRGIALAAAVFAVAAVTPTASAAASPRVEARLAQVLSPRADAILRGGPTITVRLRGDVTGFSATLNGRAIGSRFTTREGGRLRVARLPAGAASGLRAGSNLLKVRTRSRGGAIDVDAVRFASVRRHAPLLRVSAPRRGAAAARVRLRLAPSDAVVTARLNGRAIDPPAQRGRNRVLLLAADEGLRYGTNTLRVTAVDRARGRHDVEWRTIRIAREAPIPGAGRDRRATAGRAVVLDGRRSRAAHAPQRLRYRWRFVRKPRGSKATLRNATARRPRFTPDRPGRYRLRLTVSERMPVAAPVTHATIAATGPLASASDTTTTEVVPRTPAIGLQLDTIAESGEQMGVRVGDFFHAAPDATKPLQLLVLDRATLEPRANSSYGADDTSTASLKAAVAALDSSALVIVSTPRFGSIVPIADAAALANVNATLKIIGAAPLTAGSAPAGGQGISLCGGVTAGVCAGFSAIGIPGLPSGQGTLNPGLGSSTDSDDSVGGALRGYLQLDAHDNFTYVDGDYVAFDTTAPGTTNSQAAIQVGGQTYTSDALANPLAGVYVLVLDAGTLAYRSDATFALRYGPLDPLVTNMQNLSKLLDGLANDPSVLVFVQTIGRLARWDTFEGRTDLSAWWNRVAASLQHLGGHAMLFDTLTDHGYTQVGPAQSGAQWGYPAPWTKLAGPTVSNTAAQLAGTLSRNGSSQFYAQNAAAVPTPTDDLPLVAYQAPTPWPLRAGAATRAAISCVADTLDLEMPIEASYSSGTLSWGTRAATVSGLTYDELEPTADCQPKQFAAADLSAVKVQLGREFTAVDDLRNWIARVKEPFAGSSSISPLKVAAISDAIEGSVKPPADKQVGADGMGIAEDAFLILGALPGIDEFTFGGPDMIASLIGLVADTTTEPAGPKELEYDAVSADELGITIDEGYLHASQQFDQVFAILVGDWGKLSLADERQQPGGPWEWSDEKTDQAIDLLGYGAQRQAYEQLVPTVYDGLLRGTRGSFPDVPNDARDYVCSSFKTSRGITTFEPFGGASAGGVQTVVTNAGPQRENWVLSNATPANTDADPGDTMLRGWQWAPSFPSAQLTSGMFATNATGLDVPPLLPLPYALSVYGRLKVLTITWGGAEDADGNSRANFCFGR